VKYRPLGRTGLQVSELGVGTLTFGRGTGALAKVDQPTTDRMVNRALDAGVNLFDTADVYGNGTSEEILGRVLRRRRDDVLIATKTGFASHGPGALSYDNVVASCEASLRRLGTDRIDLYQLHRPDRTTPLEETMRALDDLVTRGLVRDTGTSNFRAWETAGAVERQRALGQRAFTSAQLYYSLVGRDAEHELLPHCRSADLGVLVWSPLAGGLLTGRYADGGAGRRSTFTFPPVDAGVADRALAALAPVATTHGVSVAQVALAWLLARRGVTSVLVGASALAQLGDNLDAASLVLSPAELAALDFATAPAPVYPAWWDPAMGIPTPEDVAGD
jgi:aryl-alcohol dehydrogenase-like predicted oxidoreductase